MLPIPSVRGVVGPAGRRSARLRWLAPARQINSVASGVVPPGTVRRSNAGGACASPPLPPLMHLTYSRAGFSTQSALLQRPGGVPTGEDAFTVGSCPGLLSEDHLAFRHTVRSFVEAEVAPHIEAWEAAEEFPRDLYSKAADVGLLGLGFPEEYGGVPGDPLFQLVAHGELCRAGSGGLCAGLMSHCIGAPPVVALGSEEQKRRFLPPVLQGKKIMALAITEPGGGSDVANLQCRAVRDGNDYILDGEKVFITSGVRADLITVAVRTGKPSSGASGISLIVVDTAAGAEDGGMTGHDAVHSSPGTGLTGEAGLGLTRTKLRKMGWACSDTAALHFDGLRVPAANLLGQENHGFKGIMTNFNNERFMLAVWACEMASVCTQEAMEWAAARRTFGTTLISHQVVRHQLVEMLSRIATTRALVEQLGRRLHDGEQSRQLVAELCMLKNQATDTAEFCAGRAVQILGGAGYMKGTKSERIFRETKVLSIGGGAREIMKDLASRQLGW